MTSTSEETDLYGFPIVERMRDFDIPGVSIAVIEAGTVVEKRCFGVRTSTDPSPVTESTRFQACSISKPVCSLAMLRLVDRGRLDLDADVNVYLPSWQVPANGDWQPRVTLRQLASHSAGLTVHGFPGYQPGTPLPTTVEILTGTAPANTAGVRVDIVPGVQFRYSGGGTTVMHLVLEEVTGTPLADLIRELVLDPLDMKHSGYEQPLPEMLHDEAATAHRTDGSPVDGRWHVYPELGAAALWTTPTDLCRYAIGVQQALAGATGGLISAELAEAMLTPQAPPSPGAERIGRLNSVGLGPFLRHEDGRTTYFGHSGGNEGFRCHLLAHRDGFGAAVMTNSDNGGWLLADVFDAIAQAHGWDGYASDRMGELPPRGTALDRFTGVFELPSGMGVDVVRRGDRLDVTIGSQPPIGFAASTASRLESMFVDATLTLDDAGNLLLRQSDQEHVCRRR
ncbi:MAG TPA: serine hydrolase domain-containing protein [Nocardioidaceae bacterium]